MSETTARTTLRIGTLIMMLVVAAVVVGGLAFVGLGILINAPSDKGLNLVGVGPLVVSLVVGYLMSRSNLWVEIAGKIIRERRLFTGICVERPVSEITRIVPLRSGLGGISGALIDSLMSTPNRGYLIKFREGRRISIIRGDTKNIDAFMGCLRERLGPSWANDRD